MKIHRNRLLRRLALPLLKATAFDLIIRHQWTGDRLFLNSFRHKSYWYQGRNRERPTMEAFGRLIRSGDTVIEVGGHIGFVSLWFAKLVGARGRVIVFEPGSNNLPYIRRNIAERSNLELIEKAAGSTEGELEFFEDELSGQNNSFLRNYRVLTRNLDAAPGVHATVQARKVLVSTLDASAEGAGCLPDFVKIDTEGFELNVLHGAKRILQQSPPPKFMIEISEDELAIFELFERAGYRAFSSTGRTVTIKDRKEPNVFMLHTHYHREAIENWRTAE